MIALEHMLHRKCWGKDLNKFWGGSKQKVLTRAYDITAKCALKLTYGDLELQKFSGG